MDDFSPNKFVLSPAWLGHISSQVAAEQLGIKHGSLLQLLARGIVPAPARRLGRSYLWSSTEIEQARRIIAARQEAGHE